MALRKFKPKIWYESYNYFGRHYRKYSSKQSETKYNILTHPKKSHNDQELAAQCVCDVYMIS